MKTPPSGFFPPIIGSSASSDALRDLVLQLSGSDVSVVVTGESGVGKEVLVRNLQRFSPRRDGPFVSVNCAALSPGILESELFGHCRGAFTGAIQAHSGLFEQANGGTLFLDEIGEMQPFIQAKLLRVLQECEVRRMGEAGVRHVDVRVISATSENFERMIGDGRFRKDLFYRINVIEVGIRPLRERPEDILDLLNFFYGLRGLPEPELSDDARRLILGYSWPGNVRELENEIERLITLYGEPPRIESGMFSGRLAEEASGATLDIGFLYDAPLARAVGYLEKNLLKKTLIQTNWNKSQAARRLGLSRQGVLNKIERYGIRREPVKDPTG